MGHLQSMANIWLPPQASSLYPFLGQQIPLQPRLLGLFLPLHPPAQPSCSPPCSPCPHFCPMSHTGVKVRVPLQMREHGLKGSREPTQRRMAGSENKKTCFVYSKTRAQAACFCSDGSRAWKSSLLYSQLKKKKLNTLKTNDFS